MPNILENFENFTANEKTSNERYMNSRLIIFEVIVGCLKIVISDMEASQADFKIIDLIQRLRFYNFIT